MNNTNLVTGYRGENHITSADLGALNMGIFGTDKYVLSTSEQFRLDVVDDNNIEIHSGEAIINGRHVRIAPMKHEELTVETNVGEAEAYAVVYLRYTKNAETGVEDCEMKIINDATDNGETEYSRCSIDNKNQIVDFPLYLIKINSGKIKTYKPLFKTIYIDSNGGSKMLVHLRSNGGWQMAGTTTLSLPEKISEQKHGIKLVWGCGSESDDQVARRNANKDIVISDIDKNVIVANDNGYSYSVTLNSFETHSQQGVGLINAKKRLYINDSTIKGFAGNSDVPNNRYYLLAVIGY